MKRDQEIISEITALKERIKNLHQLLELRGIASQLESEVMHGTASKEIIRTVSEIVCRRYKLDFQRLVSPGREQSITLPRQIVFYLVRSIGMVPFSRIGESFGRDHGTVMHGCRSVEDRISTQESFAQQIESLKQECRSALGLSNGVTR